MKDMASTSAIFIKKSIKRERTIQTKQAVVTTSLVLNLCSLYRKRQKALSGDLPENRFILTFQTNRWKPVVR